MKRERGFAMLLLFVMAAAVAITLYMELPRVAFESQRDKEQLLIERGEQYSRAIQLYVRKLKKYPATIEELEQTNQVRFLRKRYNDPMTGKSEWRLVHVGAGGVFLDSLVHKPPAAKKDEKAANTFTYEAPAIGSAEAQGLTGQATPAFPQARPSERIGMRQPNQPGQPVDPLNPQGANAQTGIQPPPYPQPYTGQPQPQPGYPPAGFANYQNPNQQPGMAPGGVYQQPGVNPQTGLYQQPGINPQTGVYQQPGVNPPTGVYPQPGVYPQTGVNPQQPGAAPVQLPLGMPPGYPVQGGQAGGAGQYPYSTQPGAQGAPPPVGQPGTTPTTGQPGQNQALGLINQMLTQPRPAPAAGAAFQPGVGAQIGGGIAGVASTLERGGIKVYNEKDKYNEWEFLYDLTQDKTGLGQAGVVGQQLGQQPGQQPGQQSGQQPAQSPTGQQRPGGGPQP